MKAIFRGHFGYRNQMEPVAMTPPDQWTVGGAAKFEHSGVQTWTVSMIDSANVAYGVVIPDVGPIVVDRLPNNVMVHWPDHDGTKDSVPVTPESNKSLVNTPFDAQRQPLSGREIRLTNIFQAGQDRVLFEEIVS